MIKDVFLSKRQLGTNHLSVGYESSQLWVRIVWVRNVHGYETSGFPLVNNVAVVTVVLLVAAVTVDTVLTFLFLLSLAM